MVVACPTDADSNDCGFAEPITVTVGSSTFHAEESFETISVVLDCAVTGTTAATCEETYVGPADLLETDIGTLSATDVLTNTQLTTTAVTTTLSQSEIAFLPVTITAFAGSGASIGGGESGSAFASTSARTGSSSGTSTAPSLSRTSVATSSSAGSATSSSNSSGGSRDGPLVLALTAATAGLIGLTILLL